MNPDDDGPDYWMAQLEQEQQEREAADALRSFEGVKNAIQAGKSQREVGAGESEGPCPF